MAHPASVACRSRRPQAPAGPSILRRIRFGIPVAPRDGVDLAREHRHELEQLALRRLPLAMGILALFIGGALPIELHFYPGRLRAYLGVYVAELGVCGL